MPIDLQQLAKRKLQNAQQVELKKIGVTIWLTELSGLRALQLNAEMEEMGFDTDNPDSSVGIKDLSAEKQLRWMQIMAEVVWEVAIDGEGNQAFTLEAVKSFDLQTLEECMNSLPFVKKKSENIQPESQPLDSTGEDSRTSSST